MPVRFPPNSTLLAAAWLVATLALSAAGQPNAADGRASTAGEKPANQAQSATGATSTDPSPPPPDTVPDGLTSPHETLRLFLQRMRADDAAAAAACLDLSGTIRETAIAKGPELAFKLYQILERVSTLDLKTQLDSVPKAGETTDGAWVLADLWCVTHPAGDRVAIAISDDRAWRFDSATVEAIPELYESIRGLPPRGKSLNGEEASEPFTIWLARQFPESWRETTFLLPDYQWVCLTLLIVIGLVVDLMTRGVLTRGTDFCVRRLGWDHDVESSQKVWRPMGRLANATVWYLGARLIGLPATALGVLLIGLKIFTIAMAVWTAFALIELVAAFLAKQAARTSTRYDDLLVPLVSKSLKLIAGCIGVVATAQTFDLPVFGLVGGLGLGGAALAFASKDALSNLFGSITVLFDRPFEVGDWIVTDGVEGTVETVGFRSTRIRTFHNSQITLPNSKLTNASVDNLGRRRYRRIKTTLAVEYGTTPAQIDAFCEGIRELIRRHPYTRKGMYHVYFNDFGASSLDILLYCFLECPDWAMELRERHRLLCDILKLANRLGVRFAFPTSTLHLRRDKEESIDDPTDPETEARRIAAELAGELPKPAERPGPVLFTGPSSVDRKP